MRNKYPYLILLLLPFLASCAGIRYMTVETREPAQITLPTNIRKVLVVNNVAQQPDEIGHNIKKLGRKDFEKISASSDSVAIFYTEALAQFLGEEEYYDEVLYSNNNQQRRDNNFWLEQPILPEVMIEMLRESGADAIISLDKLIMNTYRTDHFYQEGFMYGEMMGRVQSVMRVYLPTMDGQIPAVQYNDSLKWEGYDIKGRNAYAELILPTAEEAMKELAIYAAEKMTKVFSPHWEMQERWLYTSFKSKMKEADMYAKNMQWEEALSIWEPLYAKEKGKINKAKTAYNIAVGYEMLGDMDMAVQWATTAQELMMDATSPNALDLRRTTIYKSEVVRRADTSNKLNMQNN